MTREGLLELLRPVLTLLPTLDADDVVGCEGALNRMPVADIEAALREGAVEGWLLTREVGGVKFGRVSKAGPDTNGYSIDVVEMSGPARGANGLAAHTHVTGEFDLCLPVEASSAAGPAFDGRRDRWVVYPPGSRHVPTVTGGRMLIAYFVKDGAIRYE